MRTAATAPPFPVVSAAPKPPAPPAATAAAANAAAPPPHAIPMRREKNGARLQSTNAVKKSAAVRYKRGETAEKTGRF